MSDNIFTKIETLVNENPVVLFMKGTALLPQCGFSGFVAHALQKFNVPFKDVNILEDAQMRQGIKDFSDWPTIPQLYINKEFIGGADIVRDMLKSGDFQALLQKNKLIPAND